MIGIGGMNVIACENSVAILFHEKKGIILVCEETLKIKKIKLLIRVYLLKYSHFIIIIIISF